MLLAAGRELNITPDPTDLERINRLYMFHTVCGSAVIGSCRVHILASENSELGGLFGQLLWIGMQCLPQGIAPLSLLMGEVPWATVGAAGQALG